MKKNSILWLFLGMYSFGYSQVITIKDQETGLPLELVNLTSESPRALAVSNAQGQANISVFKGAQKIEIRLVGYTSAIQSFANLQTTPTVILSKSQISLDQIVVSATRWSQPQRKVSATIRTITPREVALQNPQTAADLLGSSGDVFIQKSQLGGGSPIIRGFATNRLLIAVDGVRMNTAIFRSGNLQNIISLDPFAIGNTEVLFGPSSVIYGSDAIGGVMSFQTLTPKLAVAAEPLIAGKAVARYSSANQERTGHFDIQVGWKKWASVTSFSQSDFGDLRMGRHGPEAYLRPVYVQRQDSTDVVVANNDPQVQRPTSYAQINLMQKVRFKPDDKWDFTYGFHYSTTSDYARYDRHIRYRRGLPRSAEWSYGPQKWMMNSLNSTYIGQTTLYDQLTIRLAHQFFEESRIDRDLNDAERRKRVEKVNAFSANLDFNKGIGAKHQLYYGLEVVYNDVNSTGMDEDIRTGIRVPGPARYPQSAWSSYAAYLTDQYTLSDKLVLQGGVRYNQFELRAKFDTTFYPLPYTQAAIGNGALTGSAGLVYNPTENWSVRGNASTGFRSPNVDDAGKVFDSEPGSVMVPNPDLDAEYAYTVEAGTAKVFGNAAKVDLTAYYTILENALVRRNFTLNGQDSIRYNGEWSRIQAIQNGARATVYGVQLGVEVQLPVGFGFSSRFNYQRGEEELDDGTTSPLRHAAPWFGMSHLTYTVPKLTLDLYAVYNGEVSYNDLPKEEQGKDYLYARDAAGQSYSPAWYTLNFKAICQFAKHLSVSGGIENLTDQRYRPYSSGIVAPGRNFILSFRAAF